MRLLSVIIISIMFLSSVYGQDVWQTVNPKPTCYDLLATAWNDSQNCWFAVGTHATIVKSTDQGSNWEQLPIPVGVDPKISFNDIEFTNNAVFIVGSESTILKSTDGGISWESVAIRVAPFEVTDIEFVNDDLGFAVGESNTLLKTINGGVYWESVPFDESLFMSVNFFGPQTGRLLGVSELFITDDGGDTWDNMEYNTTISWYTKKEAIFINDHTGFMIGSDNHPTSPTWYIFRTIDTGQSWTTVYTKEGVELKSLAYIDEKIFFTEYHEDAIHLISSEDVGGNWSNIIIESPHLISSFGHNESNDVLAVGKYGGIMKSNYSLESWERVNESIIGTISDTQWFGDTIFAAGCQYELSKSPTLIIRSGDGGGSWEEILQLGPIDEPVISFVNGTTGCAIDGGNLWGTSDSGLNWQLITGEFDSLTNVFMLDENTIFLLTEHSIIKSSDGGVQWDELYYNGEAQLIDIVFFDYDIGLVTYKQYDDYSLLRTTNQGGYWMPLTNPSSIFGGEIYLLDQDVAYVYGNSGSFYKTTDQGQSFINLEISDSPTIAISSMCFLNEQQGFAANSQNGNIFRTSDGGETWMSRSTPYPCDFNSIIAPNFEHGVFLGEGGVISRCDIDNFVEIKNTDAKKFDLSVVPNPINAFAQISCTMSMNSPVNFSVCDKTGRILYNSIINSDSQGNISFNWNVSDYNGGQLSSGVYFIKVSDGSNLATSKIIVL